MGVLPELYYLALGLAGEYDVVRMRRRKVSMELVSIFESFFSAIGFSFKSIGGRRLAAMMKGRRSSAARYNNITGFGAPYESERIRYSVHHSVGLKAPLACANTSILCHTLVHSLLYSTNRFIISYLSTISIIYKHKHIRMCIYIYIYIYIYINKN